MKLRWGILGTGNIAAQFCDGMRRSRRCAIAAVASRDPARARQFARDHRVGEVFNSYESLIADRNIDVVYVSLPNSAHCEWTIRALSAGKHVLCEKPIAMTAAEARRMFDAAKRAKRVLMEAFMYRCHPVTAAVVRAVKRGAIGKLQLIRSSFCFRTRRIAGNVRFVPELGGGSVMDIGCYCVNFSRLFAGGEPTSIFAIGEKHSTGVDEMVSATLGFPGGILAQFTCGMGLQANNTAMLCGTDGYIEIPVPWKPRPRARFAVVKGIPPKMDAPASPKRSSLRLASPPRKIYSVIAGGELYALEGDAFAQAVLDGKPLPVTAADSIGNMRVLEQIRRKIE